MKHESMGGDSPISKKDRKERLHEPTETIAVDVKNDSNHRTFSHLDMWNLHKRQRSASEMRRRLI